jgi:predicted protein tyrosine phosphatase
MTNKSIYILSKQQFDKLMKLNDVTDKNIVDKDVAIISIHSYNDLESVGHPYFKDNLPNVLNIFFDDVENDIIEKEKQYKSFSIEQGKQLIEFIETNKEKDSFIIHCLAGISRSGAIGQFICDYFQSDKEQFKINNKHINPNQQVLKILNNLINKRYE